MKKILSLLALIAILNPATLHSQFFTANFAFLNLTDGPTGPIGTVNGGLLYIESDNGTGFDGNPGVGSFTSGDDFRLSLPVPAFTTPTITDQVFSGSAFMAPDPMLIATYASHTWRFVYFPDLNVSSVPGDIMGGMDYAIGRINNVPFGFTNSFFPVPGSPTTFGVLNVDDWTWAVIPEPSHVAFASLAIIALGGVAYRRMKLKKTAEPVKA